MDFFVTGSNLFLIFLGFCLLIVVHELGHYLAAKWAGIRVEGFSVGMGPPLVSYRRGIGWRLGSTEPIVLARHGRPAIAMSDEELARRGLGETEWTFRVFPLGGFVKMLGQEDANPSATSDAPRSYGRTPIGKRMIVVSAGVVANLVLAVLLFLIAFLAGVRFPAPIVGGTIPSLPAARAVAVNASEAGLAPDAKPGLQPGDRIESIDGQPAESFMDAVIAAAMAKPGREIEVVVRRPGIETPLRFRMTPERDPTSGMLSLGIGSASSTAITQERSSRVFVETLLASTGLADAGIRAGMRLVEAGGKPIGTYQELVATLDRLAAESPDGRVTSRWVDASGAAIEAPLPVEPDLEVFSVPARGEGFDAQPGLAGLVPALRVARVPADSHNASVLRVGDVILRVGSVDAPTLPQLRAELDTRRRGTVDLLLLREGQLVETTATVNRDGQLGFGPGWALDHPIVARTIAERLPERAAADAPLVATPAAGVDLFPRSRIVEVAGRPVSDWLGIREALVAATAAGATEVELLVAPPIGDATERVTLRFTPEDARRLAELGWSTPVAGVFDPEFVTLRATGPLDAVRLGLRETWKMALQVYLTLDRLARRSVSIDQLHGPVGIFHVGTRVADQGFMFLIFFLAAISVNLAVMNFLPIPIVDGGLFLFLVYEKIRGRPPSIAFQNAATALGLLLIGSVFLITFYNDVARLLR
jgi:regulator of sigma E protease